MPISKDNLEKISDYLWEIPRSFRADMLVPAQVYASEKLLGEISRDRSLEQLVNVATLPGVQKQVMVMPDAHEGYGFPIGGVAATKLPDGVISPGGIGYDINCGIRLLKTELTFQEIQPHLEKLASQLYKEVPSGVGRGGKLKLDAGKFDAVLEKGTPLLVEDGYGNKEDILFVESNGSLVEADSKAVSEHAKSRGRDQLGTMGAGNHFVEIGQIEQVFDEQAARILGLFPDRVTILIHTGSRGLGHQVATDYIRLMLRKASDYGIKLPDPELAAVPFSSPEGSAYFKAMCAAANFAWANRQLITWEVRRAFRTVLGDAGSKLNILYDVAHNIAKLEEHEIGGMKQKVIVHRKGATRAFAPGHPEIVEQYRSVGQPVLIPGSMGTASYVLLGTEGSMRQTFGSTCHGAGRRMSRHAAKRQIRGDKLKQELQEQGIYTVTGSLSGLAEEAPQAYKDVNEVVEVVHKAGIAKKVAKLRPVAVIKG